MGYLEKLREVELEILHEIIRICDRYSLHYFLLGGTLLGAARHQGFIPWDDDIDISMPRDDYNLFLQVAQAELGDKYFLQCYLTDKGHCLRHSKVRKNGTIFIESTSTRDMSSHHGIFVDIFPLDHAKKLHGFQKFQRIIAVKIEIMLMLKQDKETKGIKKLFCSLFSYGFLHKVQNGIMTFVKKGDYLVNLASKYKTERESFPANYYLPGTVLPFEGLLLSAPVNYQGVLTTVFGKNYMQLPPVEQRESHAPVRLSFDTDGPDEDIS